jgi:hypothetical protein
VGTATSLGAGMSGVRIPVGELFSAKRPPILVFGGDQGYFPRGYSGLGVKNYNPPLCSVEVKNEWGFASPTHMTSWRAQGALCPFKAPATCVRQSPLC